MKIIRLFALLSILCLWAVPVFAQKTVVDPNASGKAQAVEKDKPDTRLAQKVTYQAARKTVSAILAELTKQTGVTLKAGINGLDWQVRDRKMNVFVKDVPLGDLMKSIARVMKFEWASGGKGDARTYRIFMDRKTLLDAESLRLSDQERRDKEMADKRAKVLKDFNSVDQLSPADLAQLKKDSPFEYLAVKSGIASGMAAFLKDSPAALEALASGKPLTLSAGSLSASGQSGLIGALTGFSGLIQSLGDSSNTIPGDMAANMGKVSIQLNQHIDMVQSFPEARWLLGEMIVKYGDHSFDLRLMDPESDRANFLGKAIIRSQDKGRPLDEVMSGMEDETSDVVAELNKDEAGEASSEHPDDPALDEKIKMKSEGFRLDQLQKALREASTFSVVSDSFGEAFGDTEGEVADMGEMSVKDVLTLIADVMRYNWEKYGKALEFRDKEWYRKRATQIPQAWIDGWRNTLKKTGTLDIGDLARMAALTTEQVMVNLSDDDDLARSEVPMTVLGDRDLLKFYGSLTEAQRAALLSKTGLSARSLTQQQSALAETLIGNRGLSLTQYADAPPIFTGTKTHEEKHFTYSFALTSAAGDKLADTKFNTPEYKEPPKKSDDTKKASN